MGLVAIFYTPEITVKKIENSLRDSSLDFKGLIPQHQGIFNPLTAKENSCIHKRFFQDMGFFPCGQGIFYSKILFLYQSENQEKLYSRSHFRNPLPPRD